LVLLSLVANAQHQRHISWKYLPDPPKTQQRDWYQLSATEWVEVYENGWRNQFQVIDQHAVMHRLPGVIAMDKGRIQVFIPNPALKGRQAHELYFRNLAADRQDWSKMGDFTDVP
jgi:hypothetical protein